MGQLCAQFREWLRGYGSVGEEEMPELLTCDGKTQRGSLQPNDQSKRWITQVMRYCPKPSVALAQAI